MANIRHQEVLNKVVKYLQDIAPKGVTKVNCALSIQEPETSTYRALTACDRAGLVIIDKSRSPWLYFWKKGAIPNIAPAFPLWDDHIKETTAVRDSFNSYVSGINENSELPPKNIPSLLIIAALSSMDSDDQEEIAARNEWLAEAVAALYPFYNAYRIIKVIEKMPDKKRLAKSQGFNYVSKASGLDLREFWRIERKGLLKRLTDFLGTTRKAPKTEAAPVVKEPEPEPVESMDDLLKRLKEYKDD